MDCLIKNDLPKNKHADVFSTEARRVLMIIHFLWKKFGTLKRPFATLDKDVHVF